MDRFRRLSPLRFRAPARPNLPWSCAKNHVLLNPGYFPEINWHRANAGHRFDTAKRFADVSASAACLDTIGARRAANGEANLETALKAADTAWGTPWSSAQSGSRR